MIYKEHKETPIDYREPRLSSGRYLRTGDGEYIYHQHPEIWEELIKHNPNNIDIFAFTKFKNGGYDDGGDATLNLIKKKLKFIPFIPIYAFLLIVVSWILGFIVLLVKGI